MRAGVGLGVDNYPPRYKRISTHPPLSIAVLLTQHSRLYLAFDMKPLESGAITRFQGRGDAGYISETYGSRYHRLALVASVKYAGLPKIFSLVKVVSFPLVVVALGFLCGVMPRAWGTLNEARPITGGAVGGGADGVREKTAPVAGWAFLLIRAVTDGVHVPIVHIGVVPFAIGLLTRLFVIHAFPLSRSNCRLVPALDLGGAVGGGHISTMQVFGDCNGGYGFAESPQITVGHPHG